MAEFTVSASGNRSLFPVVEKLVADAPEIPNCKIIAFRQPKGAVAEIHYGDFLLRTEDVWFSHKQRMGKVDLTLYIRDLLPENQEQAIGASFILLDNALGEYFVETRIGLIDHKLLPDSPALRGYHPLSEIREILIKK